MYNIILCDDDEQFISYMHKLILASELTDKEVQFYEYNSGRKLTESLSNIKDCDLCILDIGMEDMNGDETAKIFRKTFPSSVLIFCSGIFGPTTKSFEAEPFRYLLKSYTDEQMLEMKEAIEDHRASNKQAPRSIYGKIVAEADRIIDPEITLRRTVQYGLSHYPEMDKEQQYERFRKHLADKYAEGGYLKLWIPQSDNAGRLAELRHLIANEEKLREVFNKLYLQEKD